MNSTGLGGSAPFFSKRIIAAAIFDFDGDTHTRSLQIAAYGEIDVFAIERRYSSNIKTFVVTKEKAKDMFEYVANVAKGRKSLDYSAA